MMKVTLRGSEFLKAFGGVTHEKINEIASLSKRYAEYQDLWSDLYRKYDEDFIWISGRWFSEKVDAVLLSDPVTARWKYMSEYEDLAASLKLGCADSAATIEIDLETFTTLWQKYESVDDYVKRLNYVIENLESMIVKEIERCKVYKSSSE